MTSAIAVLKVDSDFFQQQTFPSTIKIASGEMSGRGYMGPLAPHTTPPAVSGMVLLPTSTPIRSLLPHTPPALEAISRCHTRTRIPRQQSQLGCCLGGRSPWTAEAFGSSEAGGDCDERQESATITSWQRQAGLGEDAQSALQCPEAHTSPHSPAAALNMVHPPAPREWRRDAVPCQ